MNLIFASNVSTRINNLKHRNKTNVSYFNFWTMNICYVLFLGLEALSSQIHNECRRRQMQKIQKMESKQLRILFGVCILFVICHTCRIILNLEDSYLRLIKGIDPTMLEPCNEGCASTYTLWSLVSSHIQYFLKLLSIKRTYLYTI